MHRFVVAVLAALLLPLPLDGPSRAAPSGEQVSSLFAPPVPQSGSVIARLFAGEYERLADEFDQAEAAFLQGQIDESGLIDRWTEFRNSDPALGKHLGSWIVAMPDSYVPHVARGVYLTHLGWIARGNSLARDLRTDQKKRLAAYFSIARRDFETALAINPKLSIAHGYLIEIEMVRGGNTFIAYERGTGEVPQSAYLRGRYRDALRPEWFGVGDELTRQALISKWKLDARLASRTWPTVAVPPGSDAFNYGMTLRFMRNPEASISRFDAAIAASPKPYYLLNRGKAYYSLEQYDEAKADFRQALQEKPNLAEAYIELGWVEAVQNNWTDAVAYWRSAVELDPYHPQYLRYYGMGLRRSAGQFVTGSQTGTSQENPAEAARCLGDDVAPFKAKSFRIDTRSADMWRYHCGVMSVLDRAIVYGANDPELRRMRGNQLMILLGRPDRAAEEYSRLVEMEPGSAQNWQQLGQSLYETGSCKAVPALIQYLQLQERQAPEPGADMAAPMMAKLWLADIAKTGDCSPRVAEAAARYKPEWIK